MRIRLSPARRGHIAEIDELNRKCLPENYSYKVLEQIVSAGLSHVAKHRNQTIGYILIAKLDGEYTVVSLAVDPLYRRQSVGTRLLQLGISQFKLKKSTSPDIGDLYLCVRVNNVAARTLYSRMGFIDVHDLPDYYSKPNESGVKMVWIMSNQMDSDPKMDQFQI
jgi:ribosomal protein S18 acetylase RimI-like enzyme